MTQAETSDLMALIAEEHPKFLDTANPVRRLELWEEALQNVPFDIANHATKQILAESPYMPKLSDIVSRIKANVKALDVNMSGDWPVTDWEIKSWKNISDNLGIKLPAEIQAIVNRKYPPRQELPEPSPLAGKLTAVECKNRGLSYKDYCAQFMGEEK